MVYRWWLRHVWAQVRMIHAEGCFCKQLQNSFCRKSWGPSAGLVGLDVVG
jgi:hypothetical protein